MMGTIRWAAGMIALCLLASAVYAGGGTSAAPFLRIPAGARAAAMGGAFTSLSDDSTGLFYNPAGLASVNRKVDLSFMHNAWGADLYHEALSYAQPFRRAGTLGVGLTALWMPSFEATTLAQPDGTGNSVTASDLAATVGYGFALEREHLLGVAAKFIHRRLADDQSVGFAADAGYLYKPIFHDALRIGLSVLHAGPAMTFLSRSESLPTTFRCGASYRVLRTESLQATAAGDAVFPNNTDGFVALGVEVEHGDVFALRGGYEAKTDIPTVSGGVGVRYAADEGYSVRVDYAFTWQNAEGVPAAHRISLSTQF